MKDRITQFLTREGITPAEFADKIGVQRSSVSHVLNGRNYPSASFIQKMLASYRSLNPRWLLLGEGSVTEVKSATVKEPSLFQFPDEGEPFKSTSDRPAPAAPRPEIPVAVPPEPVNMENVIPPIPVPSIEKASTNTVNDLIGSALFDREIERIVLFYKDKTFAAYTPSK